MKIPLHHFEQLIDPTILKRGLAYFKKGLVLQEGEGSEMGARQVCLVINIGHFQDTMRVPVKNVYRQLAFLIGLCRLVLIIVLLYNL